MKYRDGYKYQLAEDEMFQTEFKPREDIATKFLEITSAGELTCKAGYAWDGVSGPVIDRKTNIRASLCHDALYQLMRMGKLPSDLWRYADKEFARILKQDGAWRITIEIDMLGLKVMNGRSALPSSRKKVITTGD